MSSEVENVRRRLAGFSCRYWIAGGWAVDMFLGGQTRPHKDIEIALARADQRALLSLPHLEKIEVVKNRQRQTWEGEELVLPVHELYASFTDGGVLEILLNEFDAENWIYRRDARITLPKSNFVTDVLPIGVALLFKSKNPRPEDGHDFNAVREKLSPEQRRWLREAITLGDAAHPWLEKLA